jgi:hypothetical protein
MILRSILILLAASFLGEPIAAQISGEFEIARAKYRGGGDWYNDPSALENLIRFTKNNVPIPISESYRDVDLGSAELNAYPFVFLTGHGNITLNNAEVRNVREYLENGGFLYIDDDYGLDEYIQPILEQIFPEEELMELPFNFPIFDQVYSFENGTPKIHEHDGKPPQTFGLFHRGRLVLLYTLESNLGDGWTDAEVHNVPQRLREQALQMGANILVYALTKN